MENEKTCIFCKIINKEIPAKILAENEYAICFMDINPISNGHCIVIPKKHYINFSECNDKYLAEVSLLAKKAAYNIKKSKLEPWGINYVSNEEHIAGQEVFHYHLHVIPKYAKNEGLIFEVKKHDIKDIKKVYEIIKSKFE